MVMNSDGGLLLTSLRSARSSSIRFLSLSRLGCCSGLGSASVLEPYKEAQSLLLLDLVGDVSNADSEAAVYCVIALLCSGTADLCLPAWAPAGLLLLLLRMLLCCVKSCWAPDPVPFLMLALSTALPFRFSGLWLPALLVGSASLTMSE